MPDSHNHLSSGRGASGGYRKPLLAIAAGILLCLILYLWVAPRIGFAGYGRNCFYLQDYAYHIILIKHFWFEESGNIYDLDFQLQALSAYMGRPAMAAMPVAVTPVALIVWLPFAYIAKFSLPLAYSLWVAVSIGILALALWKTAAPLFPFKPHEMLPVALCGLTLFSLVGVSAVIVGQTSFLAGGILTFVVYRLTRLNREGGHATADWLTALLVVSAGLKPPYLIIGLGLLWVYGRWREFCLAAVLLLLLTAALTPLLSGGWLRSYVNALRMYGSGNFPDIYAWSIAPGTMNILRSAISGLTGDRAAAAISTVLSGVLLSGIGIFSLYRPTDHIAGAPRMAVAVMACCLLLSPNWGAYEDILLIPAFVTVLISGRTPPLLSFKGAAIACALFLSLFHNFPGLDHDRLWIFFVLKFLVLASMVYYAENHSAGRNFFIRS